MVKKNDNSKMIIIFIICALLGAFILFLINNFWTQGAYDLISCSYNENDCDGGCGDAGDCDDWDGVCTSEIEDDCCTSIRTCAGQIVSNPYECYKYYCFDNNQICKPIEQEGLGLLSFKCTCSEIPENPLL